MAVYRSTVPIAASPEVVWGILVAFERWPEWNPSVPSIRGEARVGATVRLTLAMPGRPSAKVRATVTEVEPERRLCWHGTMGGKRIFAGTRTFELEPQPNGTVLFTHVEEVTGVLFPLFRALMGPAVQRHHDNLGAALTRRAEGERRGSSQT